MGFGRSCMLEREPIDNLIAAFFIGFKKYSGLYWSIIAIEVKVRAGEIS
jgi:hypothetical protein